MLLKVSGLALLLASLCSATHFTKPDYYTRWVSGSTVHIQLIDGFADKAEIRLFNNAGFLPSDMGVVATNVSFSGKETYKFHVWDELPSGKSYQLSFVPGTESGNATNAFSPQFSIWNKADCKRKVH
ncbi:hypothetical protein BDF14DRAFT_1798504 [Spinellus fusiger]|nr:hypothetical protein BDF14DRAFT_1798504 [Spinellus fusiger]